jgi:hypothetical protein
MHSSAAVDRVADTRKAASNSEPSTRIPTIGCDRSRRLVSFLRQPDRDLASHALAIVRACRLLLGAPGIPRRIHHWRRALTSHLTVSRLTVRILRTAFKLPTGTIARLSLLSKPHPSFHQCFNHFPRLPSLNSASDVHSSVALDAPRPPPPLPRFPPSQTNRAPSNPPPRPVPNTRPCLRAAAAGARPPRALRAR